MKKKSNPKNKKRIGRDHSVINLQTNPPPKNEMPFHVGRRGRPVLPNTDERNTKKKYA